VISTSAYDGLGRRITKVVTNCGDLDMTYHFYYSGGEGQSIVELRNGSDMVLKQHVWAALAGGYIDELLENAVNEDPTDGSEQDCELRGWACHDANYNVIGFIDDGAAVLERYEYTPYGQRVVFYSAGSNDPLAHTPTLIPRRVELGGTLQAYGAYAIGHQGLYHDEETGEAIIYNRARMLHTRLGRFTQHDPLGYVDGMSVYEYLQTSPISATDPSGLRVSLIRTTIIPRQISQLFDALRGGRLGANKILGTSNYPSASEVANLAQIDGKMTSEEDVTVDKTMCSSGCAKYVEGEGWVRWDIKIVIIAYQFTVDDMLKAKNGLQSAVNSLNNLIMMHEMDRLNTTRSILQDKYIKFSGLDCTLDGAIQKAGDSYRDQAGKYAKEKGQEWYAAQLRIQRRDRSAMQFLINNIQNIMFN
jgi:RHS repeat-associated protein